MLHLSEQAQAFPVGLNVKSDGGLQHGAKVQNRRPIVLPATAASAARFSVNAVVPSTSRAWAHPEVVQAVTDLEIREVFHELEKQFSLLFLVSKQQTNTKKQPMASSFREREQLSPTPWLGAYLVVRQIGAPPRRSDLVHREILPWSMVRYCVWRFTAPAC